jgi:methylated-DNA-[protein]-cysteine S-methyltransferase
MKPSITCVFSLEGAGTALELACSEEGIARARFCQPPGRRNGLSHEEEVRAFAHRHPWFTKLVEAVQRYLAGEVVDFSGFPVDLGKQPPFRTRVLEACRRIPYGRTMTYAQLAAKAGNPHAARAAGSAMSHNPVPIIIPCHRVLRTGGGLGGFSSPGGVSLKERLLAMESVCAKR